MLLCQKYVAILYNNYNIIIISKKITGKTNLFPDEDGVLTSKHT